MTEDEENPLIELLENKDTLKIIKKEDPEKYQEIISQLDKIYQDSVDNMKDLSDILQKLVATGNFPNNPTDYLFVEACKKIFQIKE